MSLIERTMIFYYYLFIYLFIDVHENIYFILGFASKKINKNSTISTKFRNSPAQLNLFDCHLLDVFTVTLYRQ